MSTPLEFPLLLYCHAQDLVFVVVVTGLTLSIFSLPLLLCRVNNEILDLCGGHQSTFPSLSHWPECPSVATVWMGKGGESL